MTYEMMKSQMTALIGLGLLLVAVFGVTLVVIFIIRSRVKAEDSPEGKDFTLNDLRRLLSEGQITQDEFNRLRDAILAEAREPGASTKPPSSPA